MDTDGVLHRSREKRAQESTTVMLMTEGLGGYQSLALVRKRLGMISIFLFPLLLSV